MGFCILCFVFLIFVKRRRRVTEQNNFHCIVVYRDRKWKMEGQEGEQQPHLVLAHKLFLLTHPDVPDIEKVRLRDEVFASVKADSKTFFFSSCLFLISPPRLLFTIIPSFAHRYG